MFVKKTVLRGILGRGAWEPWSRGNRGAPQYSGRGSAPQSQLRLCARFDDVSIAEFPVAAPGEMGVRVVDNCAEENIQ